MKEMAYRDFSLRAHQMNSYLGFPSSCQFELTFRCGFHCPHCYTDCYNKPSYIAKELDTQGIRRALDRIRQMGVVWLCLTGGDPLARPDFIDIYRYAKKNGFMVTVFSNGYLFNRRVLDLLKKMPPFCIEITLNAVHKRLYEKISGVKGSFAVVMRNIRLIKRSGLPLKVKTQVTKENILEFPKIKDFVRTLNVGFSPSSILYARLNGDTAPCDMRLSPEEMLRLDGLKILAQNGCSKNNKKAGYGKRGMFPCAVQGGSGIIVDPYGSMFLCSLLRKYCHDILKAPDPLAFYNGLLSQIRGMKFLSDSLCRACGYRLSKCLWCPGAAFVEKGDHEQRIEYFCQLAKMEGACV